MISTTNEGISLIQSQNPEHMVLDVANDAFLHHESKRTEIIKWALFLSSLISECSSLVFDQLRAPNKPIYGLMSMITASLGFLISIIELSYRVGEKKLIIWRLLGDAIENLGLFLSTWQCIYAIVQYVYIYEKKINNPIKINVLPLLFLISVAISKLYNNIWNDTSINRRQRFIRGEYSMDASSTIILSRDETSLPMNDVRTFKTKTVSSESMNSASSIDTKSVVQDEPEVPIETGIHKRIMHGQKKLNEHHKDQNLSALDMFMHIVFASMGKQIVIFLNYDGTLSPIVENPDRAFMWDKMQETMRELSTCFPTAIISAKSKCEVYEFVGLNEPYYAGNHGMDIARPVKGGFKHKDDSEAFLCQPAIEFLPIINEVYKELVKGTKSIPGVEVENKKFYLSVHYGGVEEKNWSELTMLVHSAVREYPKLRLTRERNVLQIQPSIKWDKAMAFEFLLESLGFTDYTNLCSIYIGIDESDEIAFKILGEKGRLGFGILVSNFAKATNASYSLKDTGEVMNFLERLLDWSQMEKRAHQIMITRKELEEFKKILIMER